MRHPIIAVIGAAFLAVAACGGAAVAPTATASPSPSPTRTPAPTPSPVSQVIFTADLKATNSVPPIADAEKDVAGTATITFDLTRDSGGKVTSANVKFDFALDKVPATSKITLAHIHEGAATANGGVKINTGITPDAPLAPTGGKITFTKAGVAVADAALLQAILDNPAAYYFNTHSLLHGGGVARGQLTKKP